MRQGFSPNRARGARLAATLAALCAAVLAAPGNAAANHFARALPSQVTPAPKTSSVSFAAPVQWCGNDTMARDRFPDAIGGDQIHVVYAYPADRPNRLPELASGIATDLAAIDEWWRKQDSLRTPRYDTFAFPGCPAGMGQLDISAVQLAGTSASWDVADRGDLVQRLYTELLKSYGGLYGGKKYLVYWDAPARRIDACAFSVESVNVFWYLLDPPMPGCPPVDVGQQTYAAMVTAHEMVHNLGAVRVSAPHHCENGHVCDDARDVLYGIPVLIRLEEAILDVNKDDYYAHSGSWVDVQSSSSLSRSDRPLQTVALTVDPPVGGNVWTEQPGIQCPSLCSVAWEGSTEIDFRASAAAGYRFAGWSGGCSGTLTRCRRTVGGDFTATAKFTATGSGSTRPGSRNRAPRAIFGRLPKFLFETDETIGFSSASADSDGTIASAEWDFGDGTPIVQGTTATHVFTKAGRFRVTLKVTDDDGAVGRMARTISVRLDPPRLYLSRGFGRPGSNLTLRFRASDRTALSRMRIEVMRGRKIVKRQAVVVAGVRYTYSSLRWRAPARPGKVPLQWCAVATDVFKHTSRHCVPIRLFGSAS